MFVDAAVLPDEFDNNKSLTENLKENTRIGAGFGLQFIHDLAQTELYYSAYARKKGYEFGAELRLNFGLD